METDNETCMICQEKAVNASINSCAHKYCFACIVEWSKQKNTCPCCRKVFTEVKDLIKGKKKSVSVRVQVPAPSNTPHISTPTVRITLTEINGRNRSVPPSVLNPPRRQTVNPLNSFPSEPLYYPTYEVDTPSEAITQFEIATRIIPNHYFNITNIPNHYFNISTNRTNRTNISSINNFV